MTAKRFTMCHEQNDINGWTMSIVDWQTKQPFDYTTYEVHSSSITDTKDEMEDLCLLLNDLHEENEQLKKELQEIQDGFEFNWTQNYTEYDKDTLHIKDSNTEIRLNDRNLFIEVYIPQINEYYRFKYKVTGRSLMKEFIEKYNSKSDDENF